MLVRLAIAENQEEPREPRRIKKHPRRMTKR